MAIINVIGIFITTISVCMQVCWSQILKKTNKMKNTLDLDEKAFEMIREEKLWNAVPRLNPT
jgi:hypothetical protein